MSDDKRIEDMEEKEVGHADFYGEDSEYESEEYDHDDEHDEEGEHEEDVEDTDDDEDVSDDNEEDGDSALVNSESGFQKNSMTGDSRGSGGKGKLIAAGAAAVIVAAAAAFVTGGGQTQTTAAKQKAGETVAQNAQEAKAMEIALNGAPAVDDEKTDSAPKTSGDIDMLKSAPVEAKQAKVPAGTPDLAPDGKPGAIASVEADEIKRLDARLDKAASKEDIKRILDLMTDMSKKLDDLSERVSALEKKVDAVGVVQPEKMREEVRAIADEVVKGYMKKRMAHKKVAKGKGAQAPKKLKVVKKKEVKTTKQEPHIIHDWRLLAWSNEDRTAIIVSQSGGVYMIKFGKLFKKGDFVPQRIEGGKLITDKGIILNNRS